MRRALLPLLLAALLAPPGASAAVLDVGAGALPNVAVDDAGTAYIAWLRGANPSQLAFCKLPRGATGCDPAAASTIPTPGDTINRPFVVVSGNRVVVIHSRYGGDVPTFRQTFAYISTDGGATFGAPVIVGDVVFDEGVPGPGDTFSGVDNATSTSTTFQNVPIDGSSPVDDTGASTTPEAPLAQTHPYLGSVALIGGLTPIVTSATGSGDFVFRRHSGTGSLNDPAAWDAARALGSYGNVKLASGPSGLFAIATSPVDKSLVARKWDGTDFGAPASVGTTGDGPSLHAFQDAGGRTHVIAVRGDAAGLHLVHALSDDGATWRSGVVASHTVAEDGGIEYPRVATAPDHIGVVVWRGSAGIRVAAVGPDAPGALAKPKPAIAKPKASARVKGKRVRLKASGKLTLPEGVSGSDGCRGGIRISVLRGKKRIARKAVRVKATCGFSASLAARRSRVGKTKRLKLRIVFAGNAALAARTVTVTVRIR